MSERDVQRIEVLTEVLSGKRTVASAAIVLAKGRVERANRTLQDRLVKELRLASICDIEAGNAFLPGFLERFNERFVVEALRPENLQSFAEHRCQPTERNPVPS